MFDQDFALDINPLLITYLNPTKKSLPVPSTKLYVLTVKKWNFNMNFKRGKRNKIRSRIELMTLRRRRNDGTLPKESFYIENNTNG
jgi:hypothetical protein